MGIFGMKINHLATLLCSYMRLYSAVAFACRHQGCQMVYFQTKNPKLGKSWRFLQSKVLLYFMAIWPTLGLFGNLMAIWYNLWKVGGFFPRSGMLYQEKSGNPGRHLYSVFFSKLSLTIF
jgi:hypothetical protein